MAANELRGRQVLIELFLLRALICLPIVYAAMIWLDGPALVFRSAEDAGGYLGFAYVVAAFMAFVVTGQQTRPEAETTWQARTRTFARLVYVMVPSGALKVVAAIVKALPKLIDALPKVVGYAFVGGLGLGLVGLVIFGTLGLLWFGVKQLF